MASPFKIFRKNQKMWLAGLTIVAMGGFVVLPTVVQMVGRGGQAAARKNVVTTKKYGNLNAADVSALQRDRQAVRGFLNRLDLQLRRSQPTQQMRTEASILAEQLTPDRESVVETWLLVNHAEDLGVVIDDAAVNAFLKQLTQGVVSTTDLIGTGGQDKGVLGDLPETEMFRLLAYELTAMRVRNLVFTGLIPMTPGERWDYYQRVHREMTVELAEVPVERFVASVADPKDSVLQEFFDRYKEKENVPGSPEPGFEIPQRIAVEYFKVDYDHLFAEGELEKYYEEHKEDFKRETLPEVAPSEPAPELKGSLPGLEPQLDMTPAEEPKAEEPKAEEPKAEEPKAEEPKAEEPKAEEPKAEEPKAEEPKAEEPKAEEPKAEEPKAEEPKAEEPKAEEPKAEEPKAEEPKAEEPKAEEPKAEEPKAEEPKAEDAPKPADGSRVGTRSLFQLTAYQAEEEKSEPEAKDEEPAKADAEQEKPAEEPKADEEKKEEKPAEAKADEPAAPAEEGKADGPSALDIDMPKFEPPSEYYTFEEVKSQIQGILAQEKIDRIFRPLENQMTLYHDAYIRYIREKDEEGNSSVEKPADLGFAKLAEEAGIEAKKTELFSEAEVEGLDLDIASSQVMSGGRPTPFITYAFDSMAELRPARSQDYEGNHYLFWKTKQEPQRVPELKDEGIRPMVVNAWKMIEARGAAQAEAERLAGEARSKEEASKDPLPLAEALAGQENLQVEKTQPFSWFDPMSVAMAVNYGRSGLWLGSVKLAVPEPKEGEEAPEPETVPYVGSDFMRAAMNLAPGGIGIAWNQPKTVVYVLRMVEKSPADDVLRHQFLSFADPRELNLVANAERREAYRQWMKSLEKSVGLEWHQ